MVLEMAIRLILQFSQKVFENGYFEGFCKCTSLLKLIKIPIFDTQKSISRKFVKERKFSISTLCVHCWKN